MANGSLALFLLRHRPTTNKNNNDNNKNKNNKIEIYLNNELYYKGKAENYKPLNNEVDRDIYTFSTTEKIENDDNTIYLKYDPDEIGEISYNVYSYKASNRSKYKQCDFVIKKCNKCKECQLYTKYKQCIDTGRHTPNCPNSESYFSIKKTNSSDYNSLLNYYMQKQNDINITTAHNHFWKVGNNYYFNLPYLTLYKNKVTGELSCYHISPFRVDSDDWEIITSLLSNNIFIVDDREELINKYWPAIINANPVDMFEMKTINKYKDEVIPRLILDINVLDEELAKELKINNDKLNYVGKFAQLRTLNKNIECYTYDNKGNRDLHLKWDGEYVTLLNPDQLFFLSKYKIGQFVDGECRFIPNNDLVVKIEYNNWVNENTIII